MLYGPESDRIAFQPIEHRGAGVLPGFRWHGDGHGNQLVPLFARGAGANAIVARATKDDPRRGRYLHQADLGAALIKLVDG
jgi:alkaline phosphatase